MSKRPIRITARYLVAVGFIYLCTACAWLYLGAVTQNRTEERDYSLRAEVGRLWGGVHTQVPPGVTLSRVPRPVVKRAAAQAAPVQAKVKGKGKGRAAVKPAQQPPPPPPIPDQCKETTLLEPESTNALAKLSLEHRRKGLLWYSTYGVKFDGTYTFKNMSPCLRKAQLWVAFPASGAIYDSFTMEVDGVEVPVEITTPGNKSGSPASGALARVTFKAGGERKVRLRYNSRGMDRWNYSFGPNTARAKNFKLVVKTNFDRVDFPAASLSPSDKRASAGGWDLIWQFGNLLADTSIAVDMPQRINPGPLSAEISKFAPVSLFFFFFVLLLVTVLRQIPMHPVHYGMLAAAFFAFHLLMAYLVDHLPLWLAFSISSVTSVGLVTSYLRLAVGTRFALLWAGGAQLLYLVLFSLAFFLEGYTGLTITIFSVLTLFVVMQLTGRIDWSEKFGASREPDPEPGPPPNPGPMTGAGACINPVPAAAAAGPGPDLQVFTRVE